MADDEENPNEDHIKAAEDRAELQRRIPIEDIPAFMNYLKVSEDDEEYIDMMCDKILILQEDNTLVQDGLTYNELF